MIWSRNKSVEKRQEKRPQDFHTISPAVEKKNILESSQIGPVSSQEQVFALTLHSSTTPEDPSVKTVWTYNIPVLSANEKKLLLSFTGGEFLIINVASTDFPQQVYLSCSTLNGYNGNDGTPSHAVAIFRIREIMPTQLIGGLQTFTLIYSLMQPMTWDIGLNRTLAFTVGDDTSTYDCPLPMVVRAQLKILHVAY